MDRALADPGVAVAPPPPLEPSVLRAAAILFANEPRDFIRAAAVQLVRRPGVGPGPGPSAAREECSGPLVETIDCCLRFIDRHTRRFEAVAGLRREVLPEYPQAALREAVVNALAHPRLRPGRRPRRGERPPDTPGHGVHRARGHRAGVVGQDGFVDALQAPPQAVRHFDGESGRGAVAVGGGQGPGGGRRGQGEGRRALALLSMVM